MVNVEIIVYGAEDAVLRTWGTTEPTLAAGMAWCAAQHDEVVAFCVVNGAHFVDQHVYDPEQDARNR